MAKIKITGLIAPQEMGCVTKEVPIGTTYEEVVEEFQQFYEHQIVLVKANGVVQELFKTVSKDCELTFITLKDNHGHKSYVRSATKLLMKNNGY